MTFHFLRVGISLVCAVGFLACAKPQVSEPIEGGEASQLNTESGAGKVTKKPIFEEKFQDGKWRDRWTGSEKNWSVVDGKLNGRGDRNQGLWWTGDLPQEVRIEFEAWAKSDHGDLKVELLGEKREHQSGYVVILGGWQNRISIIARLDEHGTDRVENRKQVAVPQKKHVCVIERIQGILTFQVDGELVARYEDSAPLSGSSFGFANWEAPVAFDNLRIFDLAGKGVGKKP